MCASPVGCFNPSNRFARWLRWGAMCDRAMEWILESGACLGNTPGGVCRAASALELRVQLADAVHGHGGGGGACFHPELGEHTLQVLLHRGGAGTQDVADVAVDLALEYPVQHLGLARREPESQAHGFDDLGVGHLAHHQQPVAAALAVARLLVQAEGEAPRALLDGQAWWFGQRM